MSIDTSASFSDQGCDPFAIPAFLDRRRRIIATSCVPARGAARASAMGDAVVGVWRSSRTVSPNCTPSATTATVAEMRADDDAMQQHVLALFGAANEGQVELAWIKQGGGAGAELFQLNRIDALIERAIAWNTAGRNVYIGATLKHPDTAPFGRTSDSDAYAAWAFWLDLDEPGAVERAEKLARKFPPTLKVTTATTPHVRQHWWWRIDEPVTDMALVRSQASALASNLGGDPAVCNPGRIMRLGGSIAWPTKPGRVAQIVSVVTGGPTYSADILAHHAAPTATTVATPRPTPTAPSTAAPAGTGSLGVLEPLREDNREQYMRNTVHAVGVELTGVTGAWPTGDEIFEIAWPQFQRRADLSRPGRITAANAEGEMRRKCAAWARKATAGGHGELEDVVEEYKSRRKSTASQGLEDSQRDLPASDWRRELVRLPNGRPYFNIANAITVLRHHEDVAGLLAFDEFADRRLLMCAVPGSRRVVGAYPRELDDDDLTDIASWFAKNGFPLTSKATVADAVGVIVRERVIHPVRHWLDGLSWDGVERLDRWLIDYMGAADTEFARQVGASWLISAVARVMQPGCKADGVLILEGHQGIGKSTALRVLAGDWFGDALPPMTSKDASSYLRGAWIIELSELSAMSRADVEAIKAFLSRSEERFRPAYGRYEITVPRQCVFAGTTNQSSYLQDATGNRRFWPVAVGNIDLKRVQEDREQLLAEAVAAFRAKRQWWLPPEAEAIARVEQAARVAEDVWLSDIARYVAGREAVAVRDVATEAIGMKIENVGRAEQLRISNSLRTLGFDRKGVFTSGPAKGSARFLRTATGEPAMPPGTEF